MAVQDLETKRLILMELKPKHIDAYQKGFATYDVISQMNSRVPWPYPDGGAKTYLEELVFPHQGKTLWQWGIFTKENPDVLMGSITLSVSDRSNRGFWLAKEFWGRGYMAEATERVTAHAFQELGFEVLRFTNGRGNDRSRRIKEKEGARLVKVEPLEAKDFDFTEVEHWELTKEEWLNRHSGL